MKLSDLLASRPVLLRQAHLANAALAYTTIEAFAARARAAGLRGPVRLQAIAPSLDRFCPQLIALAGSQAALEEHFDESDLARLADALAFATECSASEFDFNLEDLPTRCLPPLRALLREAGVEVASTTPVATPRRTRDSR
jgi:hypothetical protein